MLRAEMPDIYLQDSVVFDPLQLPDIVRGSLKIFNHLQQPAVPVLALLDYFGGDYALLGQHDRFGKKVIIIIIA